MSSPSRKLAAGGPEDVAKVIRMLAEGRRVIDIAAEYGCDHSSVSRFKARNMVDVQRLQAQLEGAARDADGLWIADKLARVAVLQDQAERLQAQIDAAGEPVPELERTLTSTLHEVAEQLGQLPARTVVASSTVVNYVFNGVELDAL